MPINVDLTVVSLIAGMVALAVGVLAVLLSVLFYMKSNDLVLETTKTLGEIKQTTKSLEQSMAAIITRTIDYLMGGGAPPGENFKKVAITTDDLFERVKAELGDTELAQKVEELEAGFNDLREEYAAAIQDLERRRALSVPSLATLDEFEDVTSKKDYVSLLVNEGWTLYLAGDLDGSIQSSRRALDLDPNNGHAGPNLALALLSKGQKTAALEQYKAFVDGSPDATFIWIAVQDLEEARARNIDGLDDAVKMLVQASEATESGEEEIPV